MKPIANIFKSCYNASIDIELEIDFFYTEEKFFINLELRYYFLIKRLILCM